MFLDRVWLKYKSDKKTSINYADKQGKKDISVKDDSMYFAANDVKAIAKLKTAIIDIPLKYLDAYKKFQPLSEIQLAKSSAPKNAVSTFAVKKSL